MYKMIVLDMDGTLLNSQKKISHYNQKILLKAKRQARMILASARGFYRIKPYLTQLDLLDSDNYTIAFNGSLIVCNDGTVLADQPLDPNDIMLLEKYIKEQPDLDWFFYHDQGRIDYHELSDVAAFLKIYKVYKVVAFGTAEKICQSRKMMPQVLTDHLAVTSSEDERMEMVAKGMNKVDAIKYLADRLNIKREEIIAMGDGENDLAMLKLAEVGVAMANAQPALKAAADFISDTNDNDGVGKALLKIMNINENGRF